MKAMILSAGRGERLRPLTDRIPKPLIEIGERSLIERHVTALEAAGIREIVINLAWLGDAIERQLGDGSRLGVRIRYSREPEGALETAGGIHLALPLLGDEPFIVISSDVLTDFPFQRLLEIAAPTFGHLVLVDNPPHHPEGDFGLDQGQVTRAAPLLTYSGIGLFHPAPFHALEPGRRPLRPLFESAIDAGLLTAERYSGQWLDVGSPMRLEEARALHSAG